MDGFYPGYLLALFLAEKNERLYKHYTPSGYVLLIKKKAGASNSNEAVVKMNSVLEIIYMSKSALESEFSSLTGDFEGALSVFLASERGIDIITTRNKRNFKGYPVKAVLPEEMLS